MCRSDPNGQWICTHKEICTHTTERKRLRGLESLSKEKNGAHSRIAECEMD